MPVRATKRGAEKTPIDRDCDVLICGASFAGLAVARELARTGAEVLMIDRYEIGERQTSACGIPDPWLDAVGCRASFRQELPTLTVHLPNATTKYRLPWSFSTFDYEQFCRLLAAQGGSSFETAKVQRREGDRVITDRGEIRAPLIVDALGWRRLLSNGPTLQPPAGNFSRGLEVHPADHAERFEIWLDRRYVPNGYAWSFPAGHEVHIGIGSFDPGFHVKDSTVKLTKDLGHEPQDYIGNWIPNRIREATEDGVFFVGDSAGHCVPLTAEGIRPALYFGIALGRELAQVISGRQSKAAALAAYGAFSAAHRWKYEIMFRAQARISTLHPKLLAGSLRAMQNQRYVNWAFARYLELAPPEFATH